MSKNNNNIDTYIQSAHEFAKPILLHLRTLIHNTCSDVEEKMKWSFPHFDFKGEMMCSMAAFKNHCAFTFWKAALLKDTSKLPDAKREKAMGQFGRITSLNDLPSDTIIVSLIKEAMQLNEKGIKLPSRKKPASEKSELIVPDFFIAAIKKNKKASAAFENFSISHRKEYLIWITEAKTELTRNKRMAQAIEWLSEGKSRNWKYEQ